MNLPKAREVSEACIFTLAVSTENLKILDA
jgi:hypothetical protein